MSWSGPSTQRTSSKPTRYKAFQVIKPFTRDEICSLKVPRLVPLEVGFHGIISQSTADGSDRYPFVILCRTTKIPQGPERCSAIRLRGEEFRVPRDHITVGNFVTENVKTDQRQLFELTPKDWKLNPRYEPSPEYEEHTWIRTTRPAKPGMPECWVFRTAPRRISSGYVAFEFVHRDDEFPSTCQISVPPKTWKSLSLNSASLVNCVVEITVDPGQRHPSRWLNIPAIGPFDCWAQALRVGVCIEFMDDHHNWKKHYLQSNKFHRFTNTASYDLLHQEGRRVGIEVDHVEVGWLHCMKIMAALLNWKWQVHSDYTAEV